MLFLSTPSFDLSAGEEPTLGPRSSTVPPPPPTPAAAATHQHLQPPASEAAARRLLEVEERLREAIEELHRHQGGPEKGDGDGAGEEQREGEWGCGHKGQSCAAHAPGNLCQSFLLSYGVRVGIGILLRAFKLARGSLLDLKTFRSSGRCGNHIRNRVIDCKLYHPIEEPLIKCINFGLTASFHSSEDFDAVAQSTCSPEACSKRNVPHDETSPMNCLDCCYIRKAI